jgi:hypothetical protein
VRVRQWFVFMFSVATCAVYQWCLPVLGGALFLLPPPPCGMGDGVAGRQGERERMGAGVGCVHIT